MRRAPLIGTHNGEKLSEFPGLDVPDEQGRDEDKSGTLVFFEPKNASRRTLHLPQRAVGALRSHRKRQLENGSRRRTMGTQGSYSQQVRAPPSTPRT